MIVTNPPISEVGAHNTEKVVNIVNINVDRSKSKLKNSSVLSLCLPLDAAPVAAAVAGVRVPELEAELVEVARLGA